MSHKLIKREPILEFLSQNTSGNDWLLNQYNADWIYCLVASQPTIDAVPVVRCKDCIVSYCVDYEDIVCGRTCVNVDADDFCSYGERKDGDGNG